MICIYILLLSVTRSEASLKLVFDDEFEGRDSIDQDKWDVQHEVNQCNGNHINQLNCKTNNKNNVRIVEGTLGLAAIRHKYLNKDYTSPLITTKMSFTYGRFEMKVALPKGKMLRPAIILAPTTHSGVWPVDGQIDILTNEQTQKLNHGIHFGRNSYLGDTSTVNENLNEFQTYILEWNESQIKWKLNEITLHWINITKELFDNYNPFSKPFKLTVSLGIGGNAGTHSFFPGQTLYERDAEDWNCSLLIFDYIRVYEYDTQHTSFNQSQTENNISSSQICNKIMPLIRPKKPRWNLIFSDEFNNNKSLDQDKWNVQHEMEDCDGNQIGQIHCKINSTRNIRLTDGTLILAAIHEKHAKNDYTAPLITTRRSFKYGRFEIRAALPNGKMLRPAIYLVPTEKINQISNVWSKDGSIEIMTNTQAQMYHYSIFFAHGQLAKRVGGESDQSLITDSIFNFHIYAMEWTETEFRWMFDDNKLFTINIKQELANNYNPFDKPFKLVLSLGVGGTQFFPEQMFSTEDAQNWKCSLLILDYVRVYEKTNESINDNTEVNKITSSEICDNVMPLIRNKPKKSPTSNNLITIISISSFLILLAIIPILFYLFIRINNWRQNPRVSERHENNEDIELYDETIDSNYCHTYDNPYETYTENENEFESVVKTAEKCNPGHHYLTMTNERP